VILKTKNVELLLGLIPINTKHAVDAKPV